MLIVVMVYELLSGLSELGNECAYSDPDFHTSNQFVCRRHELS